MAGFRVVGVGLLLLLAAWVAHGVIERPFWRAPPAVADLAAAFEGSARLPREEIERRVEAAKARMTGVNQQGRLLKLAGEVTSWVSFFCTAAITLILGYFGRTPAPAPAGGGAASADLGGLPGRVARVIGVLAALAAVLTAAGTMAEKAGQTRYDRADRAAQIIREAQRAVGDAKGEQGEREARDALDDMQRRIDQL
ncbi:MAG TPA: hypothetical protein VGU24_07195 [Microvirga sp.]|jgi:hypothetical protein|nr:hypothetical protein [Microvirga sp.]